MKKVDLGDGFTVRFVEMKDPGRWCLEFVDSECGWGGSVEFEDVSPDHVQLLNSGDLIGFLAERRIDAALLMEWRSWVSVRLVDMIVRAARAGRTTFGHDDEKILRGLIGWSKLTRFVVPPHRSFFAAAYRSGFDGEWDREGGVLWRLGSNGARFDLDRFFIVETVGSSAWLLRDRGDAFLTMMRFFRSNDHDRDLYDRLMLKFEEVFGRTYCDELVFVLNTLE